MHSAAGEDAADCCVVKVCTDISGVAFLKTCNKRGDFVETLLQLAF